MVWGCCGFIALISSREEGGAIADLLIVRDNDNKVNGSCDDDIVLCQRSLDVGLGKSSKELSNF